MDERDRQPGTGLPRLGSRSLRWAKQLFRLLVLALVAWGIYHALSRAGARLDDQQFALGEVDPRWLVVAGVCYVIGLVPCWIFWHRTLRAMGQFPRYRESLTAFWIGHLGKYVPGKAMVVVLRTALVHGPLVNKTVAATSVFVETLTMMAVGAFVSAVILVVISDQRALTLLAIGLMLGAGLPTFPPIFRRLVRLLQVHRANPDITAAIAGVGYALMAAGWIMIAVGWVFLGLSLWATLRALPIADPSGDIPLLTAAVGLAMVAGFLSLIPGGLGVRDGILITLLAPTMGGRVAIMSAILLRVVWLAAELVVSALLYGTIVIGQARDGKTIRSHD